MYIYIYIYLSKHIYIYIYVYTYNDSTCRMKRVCKVKEASVHWSAARNEQRFSSSGWKAEQLLINRWLRVFVGLAVSCANGKNRKEPVRSDLFRFRTLMKSSFRLGSVRTIIFPASKRFGLVFSDASWLGPVRFPSVRPVQFGFLFLPARSIAPAWFHAGGRLRFQSYISKGI